MFAVINVVIGLSLRTKDRFISYVSFRNSAPTLVIFLSLLGTIIGGGMFFSVGEMGFQAGIAPLAIALSYVIGYILFGKLVPVIKRAITDNDVNTPYEVMALKLGGGNAAKSFWMSMAVINAIIYFFMLAGQFLILGSFYGYFLGVGQGTVILISIAVIIISTLVYSVLGGVKKDLATDVFQVSMIGVTIVVILAFVLRGGMFAGFDQLPGSHLNGTGYGILFVVGALLFYSPSFIGRYDYWQRIIAAKDEKTAYRGMWWGLPVILLAYALFAYLGMYARAHGAATEVANISVFWSLERVLPSLAFVIVSVGLYAAVMSTADTNLNVATISIWQMWRGRRTAPKDKTRNLLFLRLTALVVGLLSCVAMILFRDVVILIVGAFSSIVIYTPSVLYVLFAKRPSGLLATLTLLIPYALFALIFVALPSVRMFAFVPAAVIAGTVLLVGMIILRASRKRRRNAGNRTDR